jgi:hypothetical protein
MFSRHHSRAALLLSSHGDALSCKEKADAMQQGQDAGVMDAESSCLDPRSFSARLSPARDGR